MSKANYSKPANRSGGSGGITIARGIAGDEIWTDPQRAIFRKIKDQQEALDANERERRDMIDSYSLLVVDLLDTGMLKSRILRLLRLSSHGLADLIERGLVVRAILETREVTSDKAEGQRNSS